ncbi:MAG: isocitrate/isopropylmalate family dehydrogenase, partial [Ignavibacteriaceae bacterium]|nr:isocitrate/isopropylmalate family dehydrogenase [Ignavibacteriaceae bacterium]
CMMLDHIGETVKADKIRKAISRVIEAGKVKTYDMMKLRGGPDVFKNGACTTQQMTNEIINNL